jgi:hypothetical protein
MHNALSRRQSDAGAFKFFRLVQALKHAKQFICVLHIRAHPVIPNEYYQVISVCLGASDLDFGLRARARKFNRIGNQINQYKHKHRSAAIEFGQRADLPGNLAALCLLPNLGEGFLYDLIYVYQPIFAFQPGRSSKKPEDRLSGCLYAWPNPESSR